MTGGGVVHTVTEREISALVLNPGEAGAVVLPASEVDRLAERLEPEQGDQGRSFPPGTGGGR